jgi:hypothetical protein
MWENRGQITVSANIRKNWSLTPIFAGRLGPQAIVPDAQRVPDLVEQTGIFHSASLHWS